MRREHEERSAAKRLGRSARFGRLGLLGVLVVLAGCRTTVGVGPKVVEQEKDVYVTQECDVRDYPAASDVPTGATNLGSVRVSKEGTDEDTYLKLREAICAKGGDALSTLRWVKELGKISGPPTELEANAWALPQ